MPSILSNITNFIIHTISVLGYPGVAILMAIESACIPLPSEIIAPFAGFLVSTGRFGLFWVAIAGGAGSMLGSWITYEIGKYGGRPLVEKYGKYILISKEDLDFSDKLFVKYGEASTFVGRLLPVVRTFISLPAGIARIPLTPFLIYSFVGSVIWTYALGYFGMKLGQHWADLHSKFQRFDVAIVALILIGIGLWVYRHINRASSKELTRRPKPDKL
jgi:membrane protein DedA with SNARE-associated domain